MAQKTVAQLRAEVIQRHRAATRKVSRLKTVNNVAISGTRRDPRRDLSNVKRYTRRQLETYQKELDSFVDRRTQFIRGAGGSTLDKSLFTEYKRAEREYNKFVQQNRAKVGDLKLPGQSMTIAERHELLIPRGTSMRQGSMAYYETNRIPTGFLSDEALKKMTKDIRRRTSKRFRSQRDKSMRLSVMKMVEQLNRPDIADSMKKLSVDEFAIIFNFSDVVSKLAQDYEILQKLMSDEDESLYFSGASESLDEVAEVFSWAAETKALRGRL